jgi:selenide,water dikinase
MNGARSALLADGVILAGGHSSEGAELGFGLSVNGFAPRDGLLLKSGLRNGQALILTKALGTGVLFSANMAGAADGHWISEALRVMQQGHAAAIAIFRRHGISACTDVTGFGLLGHLGEMLRASGMGAELVVAAIPALAGARECLAAGYRSSLHHANAAALSQIDGIDRLDVSTQALLADPQTAGGLLAGVPAAAAEDCLSELVAAGYQASVIGRVSAEIAPGRISAC